MVSWLRGALCWRWGLTPPADTAGQAVSRILNCFGPGERDAVRMSLSVNLRAVFRQRLMRDVDGRSIPAVRIVINAPEGRELIEGKSMEKLSWAIETGRDDGMQTFNRRACEWIRAGRITDQTGRACATNPPALDRMPSGINLRADCRIVE